MSPQPGEVWLAELGLAAKTRPQETHQRLKEKLVFALDLMQERL